MQLQDVQSSSQILTTNKPTPNSGQMSFLSPNVQCQSTKGINKNWTKLVQVTNLNAAITDTAVGTPRRPIQLTRAAPLHTHRYTTYVHRLIQRRMKVIVRSFILMS